MANIVLCFDRMAGLRTSNTQALWGLLDNGEDQIAWRPADPNSALGRLAVTHREATIELARKTVIEAYRFIVDHWRPGDRIFMFGAGHDAYCARTLTRLLGVVGAPPAGSNDLVDYLLATYALPRRLRTAREWRRVNRIVANLVGLDEIAVPVAYLGLWDTLRPPGLPSLEKAEPPTNVVAARHAAAIDGGPFADLLPVEPVDGQHDREGAGDQRADQTEEVWFRGTHRDVAGGRRACRPLADIALDWVLDGAIRAGLAVRPQNGCLGPTPSESDALARKPHAISLRKLPPGPRVHASVQVFLREHAGYWRRLPARILWADPDWGARGERLAPTASSTPAALLAAAS